MLRRPAAALAVTFMALLGWSLPVSAQAAPTSTTTTTSHLPGTTLEAQQRDNGHTSQAPILITSGLVAAVAVGVGGLFLKRHQD